MTIIAWDGEILAADKLLLRNGAKFPCVKLRRIVRNFADGSEICLAGYSGTITVAQEFFEWIENGQPPLCLPEHHINKDEGGVGIIVTRDLNSNIIIEEYDHSSIPTPIYNTFHAIGAGQDAGRAAMYVGASAVKAVDAACGTTAFCGIGIDTISFDEEEMKTRMYKHELV